MTYSLSEEEREKLLEYMNRFKALSPMEKLQYMGRMRDFVWKCMSPAGRRAYLESKGFDLSLIEWDIDEGCYIRKDADD